MEGDRLKQQVAKVAKEELREDENIRRQSLEMFRDWIVKNPDIKGCRTDDSFLLRFLRTKKFSVPSAQQLLTNFISYRQNYKEITYNLDILNDPVIDQIISDGHIFVSPFRDDHGRSVIFVIQKNFDYNKYNWKAMIKALQLTMNYVMESEETQVVGVTYVVDFKESTPLYTLFPLRDLYNFSTHVQKSCPLRHQAAYSLNLSATMMRFYTLLVSFLPEKFHRRLKVFDCVADLKEFVNPRALPKEYGGTMPMAEMIALWKNKLATQRENMLLLDKITVEGNSFRVLEDVVESGLPGSFRKLEMD